MPRIFCSFQIRSSSIPWKQTWSVFVMQVRVNFAKSPSKKLSGLQKKDDNVKMNTFPIQILKNDQINTYKSYRTRKCTLCNIAQCFLYYFIFWVHKDKNLRKSGNKLTGQCIYYAFVPSPFGKWVMHCLGSRARDFQPAWIESTKLFHFKFNSIQFFISFHTGQYKFYCFSCYLCVWELLFKNA